MNYHSALIVESRIVDKKSKNISLCFFNPQPFLIISLKKYKLS